MKQSENNHWADQHRPGQDRTRPDKTGQNGGTSALPHGEKHDVRAFHAGHNRTSPDLPRVVRGVALGGQDTPLKGGVLSDDQRTHAQLIEAVANRIRKLVPSHRDPEACTRVQDAYSLRCAPQVAGAVRDTLDHAARVAGWELASAVDNPVVTLDDRVESNGNFHGAPVAYVLDFLAIAAADLASMSERRTDRFLDKARNHGLNAFLADDPGVDSGLMIAQYTAAGMVSEMKRLAVPASVDSIPSSAMQEDHVSMGWGAARKLRRSVDALTQVLTIELLTAARGIQLRAPLTPSPVSAAIIAALDEVSRTAPGPDRFLADDIAAAVYAVADGSVRHAAESVAGPLN